MNKDRVSDPFLSWTRDLTQCILKINCALLVTCCVFPMRFPSCEFADVHFLI